MELIEPLAQIPTDLYCLVCREKLISFSGPKSININCSADNVELFQDIFQVFSKYMGWDPPREYKYNFHKDQFPFCRVCNLILVRIYKIHEDIQSLEKQIQQFVLSATAKIVDSEYKHVTSSTSREADQCSSNPNLKEGARSSADSVRADEREICNYHRGSISKRYAARVKLTFEDNEKLENYKKAVKSKDLVAVDFDQNDGCDGFESSPERSAYSNEDPPSGQEAVTNANTNEIQTAHDSTTARADNSDDESFEKADEEECEQQVPQARNLLLKDRIKELGPNEYVFDDKLKFLHQSPDWKCLSCNETRLEKHALVQHMKSARCSGLVSPSSVKELEHQGFKYDKLDDGRFECRRCPFTAQSNSNLKRHIVASHCKGTGKKINLFRELVKTASITQPFPNVFLVNDLHEFRLTVFNFSCSACSFRASTKTAVVRHVFEKHAGNQPNQVKPAPIPQMKMQRLGPNKYKLGDFPFEAFPGEYKCTTCGHASVLLLHMKRHIRYEHVKDMSKNVCDICGYCTFCKATFSRHMSSHKGDRPFLCPTCGKSFKTKGHLSSHESLVHPTSPIVKSHLCEICGQKFRKQSFLTGHMKRHENVNCEICGKTYNLLYLPTHLESHVDEKKYECKECGSKFQHWNGLHTHQKSCNGDKPYSCDLCDMKFTQSFAVTRHKNVVHNPEKTTRTCTVKGPRKQRRGQSLLTKNKSLAAAASGVSGSENTTLVSPQ